MDFQIEPLVQPRWKFRSLWIIGREELENALYGGRESMDNREAFHRDVMDHVFDYPIPSGQELPVGERLAGYYGGVLCYVCSKQEREAAFSILGRFGIEEGDLSVFSVTCFYLPAQLSKRGVMALEAFVKELSRGRRPQQD